MAVTEPTADLLQRAQALRQAAARLALLADGDRVAAVEAMAAGLERQRDRILAANQADMDAAAADGLGQALLARLRLDAGKLEGAIAAVRQVAALPDPVGQRLLHVELAEALRLERVSVPLGVLGVIFEARPDAVIQIASLAIRSGNGAMLKGGREATRSCRAIIDALRDGLAGTAVADDCLVLLTGREESLAMLRLDGLVDLIIPRGSNSFVRFIQGNTRIPVLGHADGICHLYVDARVNVAEAVEIAIDSKTDYPAACNAIETLLLHRDSARAFLAAALPVFADKGVELRGDAAACALGVARAASEDDWGAEYADRILAVKLVADMDEALAHIRRYGSRHTDVICSSDTAAGERFLASVDSAGVYHNCSSRFADGFRYGFGAEVGISTQTLPPRGPVGLEGLVTYRYRLRGDGQTVEAVTSGRIGFIHRQLPLA